ncbi:MAG: tRNA guanosine(34) transglycosylase Tgt, partial [Rhodospirillaceae bacterium]|nr:tRNA guanosine(34) transglycosylase Tgt [Rhodospirillaceae bacterium]
LHHLFRCNEMLGPMLLTLHNVTFYQDLMSDIRKAIRDQVFEDWSARYLEYFWSGDIATA